MTSEKWKYVLWIITVSDKKIKAMTSAKNTQELDLGQQKITLDQLLQKSDKIITETKTNEANIEQHHTKNSKLKRKINYLFSALAFAQA